MFGWDPYEEADAQVRKGLGDGLGAQAGPALSPEPYLGQRLEPASAHLPQIGGAQEDSAGGSGPREHG